ncbi:MAG: mechanosensitive ion channel family protein [Alphaproteobacteria bacterium]|nr:mechanosensitive ion channel family protein [Alphaproteobacteria bacterium]HPF45282.1 mechanosensitive ion channel family protein [Emcibacteraceae bacterium]HRW28548.1 mechanosensitive ion channel family protein [Emcibacteraceae bacterium]
MENETINKAVEEAVYQAMNQPLFIQRGITTVILIISLLILRFVLVHFIRKKAKILNKDQRQWINRINNGISISIIVALILIWAPQLHTFALSLTAVAVAVVLITKELLMCLTGGFLRASSHPFGIGDWITVDGVTGEVMKITTMTTLIEQIDAKGQSYQFTGKTMQIPNSRFLTVNVENANFNKRYVYHDVPIMVQFMDVDPSVLMKQLKNITEKYYAPYSVEAAKFKDRIEIKAGVEFADIEPQFFLKTTDVGHNLFTVRIFVPTLEALKTGTLITHDFLSFVHQQRVKASKLNTQKTRELNHPSN